MASWSGWLHRETKQLQAVAVEELRERLNRVVAANGRPPEKWDGIFQRELGAMVGGTVELFRTNAPAGSAAPAGSPALSFTQDLPGQPGWQLRVTFATPALIRVQILHQRTLAVIVLLALLLAMVPLLLVLVDSRRNLNAEGSTHARTPWAMARAGGCRHGAFRQNLQRTHRRPR